MCVYANVFAIVCLLARLVDSCGQLGGRSWWRVVVEDGTTTVTTSTATEAKESGVLALAWSLIALLVAKGEGATKAQEALVAHRESIAPRTKRGGGGRRGCTFS